MLKSLQYKGEYLLFLVMLHLVRLLPRPVALSLGRMMGSLIYFTQPKRRRKARENLRCAFPEKNEQECLILLRENFRQLGVSAVEMLRLDLYAREERIKSSFSLTGFEHLEAALSHGKGCFLLTGHVGFWEAGFILLPLHGISVDAIHKKMKNPYVEKYVLSMRESSGARGIEKNRAARKVLRSLSENRTVAVLIDQRVSPREGVIVDFLNRPAITTSIIPLIAIKQGTPVVPAFCLRLPDDRYEMSFAPMITFPKEENPSQESVIAATQILSDKIEEAVKKNPEQWFWLHDRWRL